jgi:PPOX class probable F420-dependent enzyme
MTRAANYLRRAASPCGRHRYRRGVTWEQARERFAAARVARLATADANGRPHVVPVVFAVLIEGERSTVYSAVDAKPKRTMALRRLANVRVNPQVSLLVDHYDDADWTALWWVRADGTGRVLQPEEHEAQFAVGQLTRRYPPYRPQPPSGPVLAVNVTGWVSWSAR